MSAQMTKHCLLNRPVAKSISVDGHSHCENGMLSEVVSTGLDEVTPNEAVPARLSVALLHVVPCPTRRTSAQPPPSRALRQDRATPNYDGECWCLHYNPYCDLHTALGVAAHKHVDTTTSEVVQNSGQVRRVSKRGLSVAVTQKMSKYTH